MSRVIKWDDLGDTEKRRVVRELNDDLLRTTAAEAEEKLVKSAEKLLAAAKDGDFGLIEKYLAKVADRSAKLLVAWDNLPSVEAEDLDG